MSGFSADWLALREPFDHAARATAVTDFVRAGLWAKRPLVIADLGAGTGSNVRYLAPRLPEGQVWRLYDNDERLLHVAKGNCPVRVDTHFTGLRGFDWALIDDYAMVTASALIDLVSDSWLAYALEAIRVRRMPVLFALNYDGRVELTPSDPDDRWVIDLFNAHQRTDKGFGAGLGPLSGARIADRLRMLTYEVVSAKSDWIVGPDDRELQRQLIAGWAGASIEMLPTDADRVLAWQARRLALVESGVSRMLVGHDDVGGVCKLPRWR